MTAINQIDESNFSDDYTQLVELMKVRSRVCVVDYSYRDDGDPPTRDIAKTIFSGTDRPIYQVSARGMGYLWAENEKDFIDQCQKYNLKFLP